MNIIVVLFMLCWLSFVLVTKQDPETLDITLRNWVKKLMRRKI